MRIGIPAETRSGETRVAATPETVKKLTAQGHTLQVQSGAGVPASATDDPEEAVTWARGAIDVALRKAAAKKPSTPKPNPAQREWVDYFDSDMKEAIESGEFDFILDTVSVPNPTKSAQIFAACLAADKGYSSTIVKIGRAHV